MLKGSYCVAAETCGAPADRGYSAISALALAVEAVEAPSTFLSDCDPGLTAAVRPFERSALQERSKEHHMHATIRRYEGVDVTRINDVVRKINETLVPELQKLPGFTGYYLVEASGGVISSLGLFESSEQAEESTKLVSKWITDEKLDSVIPNAPTVTTGKVVAHSEPALAIA
jgi:hypothetical protein